MMVSLKCFREVIILLLLYVNMELIYSVLIYILEYFLIQLFFFAIKHRLNFKLLLVLLETLHSLKISTSCSKLVLHYKILLQQIKEFLFKWTFGLSEWNMVLFHMQCAFFHMHGGASGFFLKIHFQFWMMFSLWPSHFITINSLLMRAAAEKIASRLFCFGGVRKAKAGMHLTVSLWYPPGSSPRLCFALRRVQWGFSSCPCPAAVKVLTLGP